MRVFMLFNVSSFYVADTAKGKIDIIAHNGISAMGHLLATYIDLEIGENGK